MTRFYAISAMVDLFEASELQALASFAATPTGRSALAKLPALGAILTPLVERQIAMPSAVSGSANRTSKCARNGPASGLLPRKPPRRRRLREPDQRSSLPTRKRSGRLAAAMGRLALGEIVSQRDRNPSRRPLHHGSVLRHPRPAMLETMRPRCLPAHLRNFSGDELVGAAWPVAAAVSIAFCSFPNARTSIWRTRSRHTVDMAQIGERHGFVSESPPLHNVPLALVQCLKTFGQKIAPPFKLARLDDHALLVRAVGHQHVLPFQPRHQPALARTATGPWRRGDGSFRSPRPRSPRGPARSS